MASEHHTDLPAGKIPQMRVVPMPNDANMHGDVFGGWISHRSIWQEQSVLHAAPMAASSPLR